MGTMKNELGNVYGDFRVIAYSDRREPTNKSVKWLCQCNVCGAQRFINGNLLRFQHVKFCQECKKRDRR